MDKFTRGSIVLHWVIALIVISMLFTFFVDYLPESSMKTVFMLHKSFGITVFVLMLLRLLWLYAWGGPGLPLLMRKWERFLSRFVQYSFYILLLIMPLSGLIMSIAKQKPPRYFNLFEITLPFIPHSDQLAEVMRTIHNAVAYTLVILLFFHITGALKHQFIDKDRTISRMLGK